MIATRRTNHFTALALLMGACATPKPVSQQASAKPVAPQVSAATTAATPATATPPESAPPLLRMLGGPLDASRPRFSPDGRRIVFQGGPEGARNLFFMDLDSQSGGSITTGLAGDSRDPTWDASGERIVFANNASGNYDLYVIGLHESKAERITRFLGDELEPHVAPLPFVFYAVYQGGCRLPSGGKEVDRYEKVVFTRHQAAPAHDEVWFVSMKPPARAEPEPSPRSQHGRHEGRISPAGKSCRSPAFGGDGVSMVWSCDGGMQDARARWEQSFDDALAKVKGDGPSVCHEDEEAFDEAKCIAALKKRYATYPALDASSASDAIAHPSVSTNQIELVGDAQGRAVHRERASDATWSAISGIRSRIPNGTGSYRDRAPSSRRYHPSGAQR